MKSEQSIPIEIEPPELFDQDIDQDSKPSQQEAEPALTESDQFDLFGSVTPAASEDNTVATALPTPETSDVPEARVTLRRRIVGGKIGKVVAGLVVVSSIGLGIGAFNNEPENAAHQPKTPATAPEAELPDTTIAPDATLPASPSTTESTDLETDTSNSQGASDAAPSPAAVAAPEKTATPEAAASELLPAAEKEALITATGFEGLRNHDLQVVERFGAKTADIVVISVDGAELSVPMSELKADIEVAEALAEQRLTFDAKLTLGPDDTRTLSFETLPIHDQSPGRNTSYFLFTSPNQNPAELAAPVSAFPESFTLRLPYKDMSVSILKDQSGVVHGDGLSASSKGAAAEAFQAFGFTQLTFESENSLDEAHNAGTLNLDNIPHPNSDYSGKKFNIYAIGSEISANSNTLALIHARMGQSHADHQASVTGLPLGLYPETNATYVPVSAETYALMRQIDSL